MAVFNDAIRDGLKGSVFDPKDTGYINGSANKTNADRVIFGLQGGVKTNATNWGVQDAMVINYMSSHDNHTLWDKLALSAPDASHDQRLAMNCLGAAAVWLGRGTPFMLAGEEMLRTKDGDSNSYRSSDEVNNLDWESLTPHSDAWAMSRFYKALIALRRDNDFLRNGDVACEVTAGNAIRATWTVNGEVVAVAIFNGSMDESVSLIDHGYDGWTFILRGTDAAAETVGGTIEVDPCSFVLLRK